MKKLIAIALLAASCGSNNSETLRHKVLISPDKVVNTLYPFRYNARPLPSHKAYAVPDTLNQPLNASCYYTFDSLVETTTDPISIIRESKPFAKTYTNNIAFMNSEIYQTNLMVRRISDDTFLDSMMFREPIRLTDLQELVVGIAKRSFYTREQMLYYLNLAKKFAPSESEGGIKCPEKYPLGQL